MADNIEIHYADEWAALYVDGKLVRVGDAYLAEERAFEMLGVKQVRDDAFMRGQNYRDGAAQTLAEVAEYSQARQARLDRASALEEQARAMLEEAKKLKEQG